MRKKNYKYVVKMDKIRSFSKAVTGSGYKIEQAVGVVDKLLKDNQDFKRRLSVLERQITNSEKRQVCYTISQE